MTLISNCHCFTLLFIFQNKQKYIYLPSSYNPFFWPWHLRKTNQYYFSNTASVSMSHVTHSTTLQMYSLSLELWAAHMYLTLHHVMWCYEVRFMNYTLLHSLSSSGVWCHTQDNKHGCRIPRIVLWFIYTQTFWKTSIWDRPEVEWNNCLLRASFAKKYFKHSSFFRISIQLPTPFSKAFPLKRITFMSDPEIPREMNYTPSDLSFPEQ